MLAHRPEANFGVFLYRSPLYLRQFFFFNIYSFLCNINAYMCVQLMHTCCARKPDPLRLGVPAWPSCCPGTCLDQAGLVPSWDKVSYWTLSSLILGYPGLCASGSCLSPRVSIFLLVYIWVLRYWGSKLQSSRYTANSLSIETHSSLLFFSLFCNILGSLRVSSK